MLTEPCLLSVFLVSSHSHAFVILLTLPADPFFNLASNWPLALRCSQPLLYVLEPVNVSLCAVR